MKSTPFVIASATQDLAIVIQAFEGTHPVPNRDATGFYFTIKRTPDAIDGTLAVLFSGTVFYIDTSAFGLRLDGDRTAQFAVFAEAAIGDYLDEHGLPDHTPSDVQPFAIECFSPHFQTWRDRAAASDEQIELYIHRHLFWSWQFAQNGWELGPADSLRLRQPMAVIGRLVELGTGRDWTATQRPHGAVWLKPTSDFIRAMRAGRTPTVQALSSEVVRAASEGSTTTTPPVPPELVFVDAVRISDLQRVQSQAHDLRKVIALCEELNQCYRSQCYYAVAALTRMLLDHVPPFFDKTSFAEVASNHAGDRSFKDCMQHLEKTARKIADMHLHTTVRARESSPTRTQVNFSQDVDVLLGEIVRLLNA